MKVFFIILLAMATVAPAYAQQYDQEIALGIGVYEQYSISCKPLTAKGEKMMIVMKRTYQNHPEFVSDLKEGRDSVNTMGCRFIKESIAVVLEGDKAAQSFLKMLYGGEGM